MKLSGDLQGEQVRRLWAIRDQWWQDETMDLRELIAIDSAGVAIMVKWAKAVRERGQTPTLIGMPDDFDKLATLYGVAGLFSTQA
ncbi:STAS domain-containing protein [Aeromonas schubertii]|uniref:STAS domain-containing protein n=1 Tax=Aeromonas schubertii TaxID=652 RepID=UPI0010A94A7C|nr:STAS domain-containing protein [Aeromonas schubertii]QCG49257.1 STAS domain-containing protein [Aeromonas schubertii]